MDVAVFSIMRERTKTGFWGTLRIEINGQDAGRVKEGESIKFPVQVSKSPMPVIVTVSGYGTKSTSAEYAASPGEEVSIRFVADGAALLRNKVTFSRM